MKNAKKTRSIRQKIKHPGEILLNEYLSPYGLTGSRLATALHLTAARMGEIINGKRGISAESAMRLSKFFGTPAMFWLNLQAEYDLSQAEEKWSETIDRQIQPLPGVKPAKHQKGGKQGKLPGSSKLTGIEKKLFDHLTDEPTGFDSLCYKTGLKAGELAAAITLLELSQLIKVHSGSYFSKPVVKK